MENDEILVYAPKGGEFIVRELDKIFTNHGVKYKLLSKIDEAIDFSQYSFLLIVGTDRDVLESLQYMGSNTIPILHVSPPGYNAFFSSLDWSDVRNGLPRVLRNDYSLEEYSRLKAVIDDSKILYGLNELALFSSRSAVLIDYVLEVDGETIWRDSGDGVIVSTPVGSTAYAYSAGGPIVMRNAEVFVIVPVNSLNPVRRPLVVSDRSVIVIREVSSRYRLEAIVDGIVRERVRREITIVKADKPAYFIKIGRRLREQIEKKTRLITVNEDIPPSAKYVYKMLEIYGEATAKDLVKITGLPERTIRYALSILVKKGLVEKKTSLRDVRTNIYRAIH